MNTIIIIILAILASLISISQYFSFNEECENERTKFHYMLFAMSVGGTAFFYALMILTYGSVWSYVFYCFNKFLNVVIMIEIVQLTHDMIKIDESFLPKFFSAISYGAYIILLVDIIRQGGELQKGVFGVYFYPEMPWHRALYFIYYIVYIIVLASLVMLRGVVCVKKSDKEDLLLLISVYSLSAVGFVSEPFLINFKVEYVPLTIIFNLMALIHMRYLLKYHEEISIRPDKFKNELDPGRTDIVFVLDDKMNIIYQNKRAEVFAAITNTDFRGRALTDVFAFSDTAFAQIGEEPDAIPFGVVGQYAPLNRQVNLVIQHKISNFKEILATVVFVYNIEESNREERDIDYRSDGAENDEKLIENAVSITKEARILIVDEDILFLNVFTRLLNRYEVRVTRARNGYDGLELLSNNVYDLIFVGYEMATISGVEFVLKLHAKGGDYYSQVPIVYVGTADSNEVLDDLLKTGFNDYLRKPISHKNLSQVLTRWLWQRFDEETPENAQIKSVFNAQYTELLKLVEDADYMYDNKKEDKFLYCIKGIKRISMLLSLTDFYELALGVEEAVAFNDEKLLWSRFSRLASAIREKVSVSV